MTAKCFLHEKIDIERRNPKKNIIIITNVDQQQQQRTQFLAIFFVSPPSSWAWAWASSLWLSFMQETHGLYMAYTYTVCFSIIERKTYKGRTHVTTCAPVLAVHYMFAKVAKWQMRQHTLRWLQIKIECLHISTHTRASEDTRSMGEKYSECDRIQINPIQNYQMNGNAIKTTIHSDRYIVNRFQIVWLEIVLK